MREMTRQAGEAFTLGLAVVVALGACRGEESTEPPIHLQRNMFTQDKGKPQRENPFFADSRTQRPPVEGTVPHGAPQPTDPRLTGLDPESGQPLKKIPVPVTAQFMARGQERFDIYCAPCHDRTGAGNGLVIQRAAGAIVKPPTYHQQRLREESVGYLYGVISNGKNTMPSYAHQIPVDDRWAIVAYLRALQRSQGAALSDVPSEERSKIQ